MTGRKLIVYREPDVTGERFASVRTLDESETITPLLAPGQSVRVSELLP